MPVATKTNDLEALLGADAKKLLEHKCVGIPKESIHIPGPDSVDRLFASSDRPIPVLRSLQQPCPNSPAFEIRQNRHHPKLAAGAIAHAKADNLPLTFANPPSVRRV